MQGHWTLQRCQRALIDAEDLFAVISVSRAVLFLEDDS